MPADKSRKKADAAKAAKGKSAAKSAPAPAPAADKPSFVGKSVRVYQDSTYSIGPDVQGEVECLDAVATSFSYLICVRNTKGNPVWFDSRRAAGIEVVGEVGADPIAEAVAAFKAHPGPLEDTGG